MTNALRQDLAELAEEVRLVDLRDRSLDASRRLGRRRRQVTAAALAAVVAVAGFSVWRDQHRPPPDGAFALDQLRDVTLDLPAFGSCGGYRITFTAGSNERVYDGQFSPTAITMVSAVSGDLYGEGRNTTALLLGCGDGGPDDTSQNTETTRVGGFPYAVLAVDRGVDGAPVVRDVVTLVQEQWVRATALRYTSAGSVDVQTRLAIPLDRLPEDEQWRTYTWLGQSFGQTGGPASFDDHPNATRLMMDASPLVLGPTPDGTYKGSTTVTIHNAGHNPIGQLYVSVFADEGLSVINPGVEKIPVQVRGEPRANPVPSTVFNLAMGPLDVDARTSVELEFQLAAPGTQLPAISTISIHVFGQTLSRAGMVDLGDKSGGYVGVIRN